jgi:hypothetical protein
VSCCSGGQVAANAVGLLCDVMWCGVTAVSDGYGDGTAVGLLCDVMRCGVTAVSDGYGYRTAFEIGLTASLHGVPILTYFITYLHTPQHSPSW